LGGLVVSELRIGGPRPLRGRIRLPGDKSISHRALLFAALAEGTSEIRGLGSGADIASSARVLEALGVAIERDGATTVVHGRGPDGWREPVEVLDTGNSGTTTRLLLGALAGRPFHSVLSGDASLNQRPMLRVVEPLRSMGAQIDGRNGGQHLQIAVRGVALQGTRHEMTVASAQVKSALVLAGLQADGVTEIIEPMATRDHPERMLAALGAPVRVSDTMVSVRRGAPRTFQLEVAGDPSSAAFWVVAACVTPDSEIVCEEVLCNPGRIGFVSVLQRMGADVTVEPTGERLGEPIGTITARTSTLHGAVVEGDAIPSLIDEIPVLAMAAAFADGVTEFRDAAELRVKESDRVATVVAALTAFGVVSEARPDGLMVQGGTPRSGAVDGAGDHRIAMAAAVAANAMTGASVITGSDAIAVSYPEFGAELDRLAGGGA